MKNKKLILSLTKENFKNKRVIKQLKNRLATVIDKSRAQQDRLHAIITEMDKDNRRLSELLESYMALSD